MATDNKLQFGDPGTDGSFSTLEEAASAVLENIANRFFDVLNALPRRVSRAVDVARTLEIERSLAWKIWRVAQGKDSYPSPKDIPGRAGVKLFLDAAAPKIPKEVTAAAWLAFDQFEELTRTHAGSRAALDSMLSRFTIEGRERFEIGLRRQGFRARSHFVGAQARTEYRNAVVFPAQPGFWRDLAFIWGFFGLSRTRANTPWILHRSWVDLSGGTLTLDEYRRGPLNAEDVSPGALEQGATIPRFCSQPPPQTRRFELKNGIVQSELAPGPIGETAAVDWVYGERLSRIPPDDEPDDSVIMRIYTPCEHACFDLFLHETVSDQEVPKLLASAYLFGDAPLEAKSHCVPIGETVQDLGSADRIPPALEVPHHRKIMQYMFDQLHQDPRSFRAYRVLMRYPPVPICLELVYRKSLRRQDPVA